MKFAAVFQLLGRLFGVIGLFLIAPAAVSWHYGEIWHFKVFLYTAALMMALGLTLMVWLRQAGREPISIRDGFLLVTLSWFSVSALGAVPYFLSGTFNCFADAFFESVSGFTTTGASVVMNVEELPKGILFWRALTQWIGGLGIIVLAVAILPQLSVGGMQLLKNEMPGPTFEQLKPRIKQTALSLWKIYVFFSLAMTAILYSLGLPIFESVCHVFTTLSTGGFSTKNASAGAFSTPVQTVIVVFMFLAGMNFVLHYAWLHGDFRRVFRDGEWRFYCMFLFLAFLLVALNLWSCMGSAWVEGMRVAVFQVVSITTSTGFSSTDFGQWPFLAKGLLFLSMFVGGCAGSTGGGFKQIRLKLLLIRSRFTLLRQIFPKAVTSVKIGRKPVSADVLEGVSDLFLMLVVIFSVCTLALLALNIDFVTATSAVIASLSNIGPGLGMVGPAQNYAWMPGSAKLLLTICMIIGRLEIFTVLVLFLPIAWKK